MAGLRLGGLLARGSVTNFLCRRSLSSNRSIFTLPNQTLNAPVGAGGSSKALVPSLLCQVASRSEHTLIKKDSQGTEKVTSEFTIFYDGSCPMCRSEMQLYQHLQDRFGPGKDGAINFFDLGQSQSTDTLLNLMLVRDSIALTSHSPPLGREDLMRRIHGVENCGQVISGAKAFQKLWQLTPGFKPLYWLCLIPGVINAGDVLYEIWAERRWNNRQKASPDSKCHVKV